MNKAEYGIKKVLISEQEIKDKISEMGALISKEYDGKKLLMVSVLKGAFVFMADLMRAVTIPCEIDFMCVSSYQNSTVSSGTVKITKDLNLDVKDYHVLIVEDILDSGNTLSSVIKLLNHRNPKSLKVVTFLDKPDRRTTSVNVDYTCFTIPDEFAIGYGLDYAEKYRNIPYIGVLDPSAIEE
ncbi:MAG TPA: hypoxanthine phosphoribosyltransferase [Oscillospiraceae bacterium]|nr:hypoxanthine phosphoribosyltransferase [Oscillospiraceae bacterium]